MGQGEQPCLGRWDAQLDMTTSTRFWHLGQVSSVRNCIALFPPLVGTTTGFDFEFPPMVNMCAMPFVGDWPPSRKV